jgi:hypothetical protein
MSLSDYKRGDVVRVVPSEHHPAFRRDTEFAAILGKTGKVTGRTLYDMIEVGIAGGVMQQVFGYLMLPEELELA